MNEDVIKIVLSNLCDDMGSYSIVNRQNRFTMGNINAHINDKVNFIILEGWLTSESIREWGGWFLSVRR